jgi:UPF0271 protein
VATIDLNCDMGESFGSYRMGADDEVLPYVTSASIACGFHGGDPRTMDRTVGLAVAAGVTVGAHVSYPDLVGFGRRSIRVSEEELVTDVLYQLGALEAFCRRHATAVRYVKAHGALYNDLAASPELAAALGRAVLAYGADLAVLTLAGSPSVEVLDGLGLKVVSEAFADRAYTADGRLVSRRDPGAVLHDPEVVAERAWHIAAGLPVEAADGSPIVVAGGSLCIHGDTPGAPQLATAVRAAFEVHGIGVAPFVVA